MADVRPCRDCGIPTRAGPRCSPCRHAEDPYGWAPGGAVPIPEATAARAVADHLDRHGRVCPGVGDRGAHPVDAGELVAVRAMSQAPAHPSNVAVSCRSCVA